jgi:two-component system, OmpR family, sensor histidine kinase KdpD
MQLLHGADRGRIVRDATRIVLALGACTMAAYVLESWVGLPDASVVYLLGVAAVAIGAGATPAIAAAIGAFFTYNFLFIEPRYTLTVANPEQLLNLLLFLIIGTLIGRLAGSQRDRAREAVRREKEAAALSFVSRSLNTSDPLERAAAVIATRLATETRTDRVWVATATSSGSERVLADSGSGVALPERGTYAILRRDSTQGGGTWRRIHPPEHRAQETAPALYRVDLAVGDESFGSLWAARSRTLGEPGASEVRLLAAAADQVAQAIRRQRLAAMAAEMEIARRSDRLKSALLDSVSHDLRTPLATIRAAAGNLSDPEIAVSTQERVALGAMIDTEAHRLNRLVSNLLDMSRVESGALAPDLELVPLAPILEAVLDRLRGALGSYRVEAEIPDELPPTWADPLMLDQVLTNLLENAAKYVPAGGRVRVRAAGADGDATTLIVEDDGPGVQGDPERLFHKFHHEGRAREGARRGTGLGLAVVRGLVEAMGGTVAAARSDLGGLAVVIRLPAGVAVAPVGDVLTGPVEPAVPAP